VTEELAVNAHVAQHHFETIFEGVAGDLAVFDVHVFSKGNAVGKGPGVALAGDGAQLIGDGEAFFMGGNDGGEKFAGKLVPEVVEEIFHRAADAAVIIGRAEEDNVSAIDAGLEFSVTGKFVGGVGIVESERFFFEVEHVHGATCCAQLLSSVINDNAGDRIAVQASGNRKNCDWLCHGRGD